MIGVDLGLNVGSITRIDKEGRVRDSLVLKFAKEKEFDEEIRIRKIAIRFAEVILKMQKKTNVKQKVAIEYPVLSWRRRNPIAFAKNVSLYTIVHLIITDKKNGKMRVKKINNKLAKKIAGGGGKDKAEMIAAFKKKTGNFPGHSTKYGQETLADSYFIALAGYEK
jgi:hypothetical protein